MTDFCNISLTGRLTRDPDIKQTQSGTSICSFSIACNNSYVSNGEKKEEVSFFNGTVWGKQGESFAKYVKKGHKVLISGRLKQESYQDKDGNPKQSIKINVDFFQFLEPKKGGEGDSGSEHPQNYSGSSAQSSGQSDSFADDDIPF